MASSATGGRDEVRTSTMKTRLLHHRPPTRRSPAPGAPPQRGAGVTVARAGLTLVELVIAAGIIAILLLASAAAMGESVESTETAKQLVRGAVFLESVQEDLSTLTPAELLAMNGQTVFSTDDWNDARYRIEISVFYAAVSLLQVQLALVEQSSGRTLATVHTMRAVV